MRGCVEDKAWAVECEDFVNEIAVTDIAEIEVCVVSNGGEVFLEIVKAVFRSFEENGVRAGAGKAACESGADGTAGAGDEDWVLRER